LAPWRYGALTNPAGGAMAQYGLHCPPASHKGEANRRSRFGF